MKENHSNYRASVIIRGAVTRKLYGKNLDKLRKVAIEKLTNFKPGECSLWPISVEIEKFAFRRSGRSSSWTWVESVKFRDVPEDARTYVKRAKERETALHMSTQRIQLPLS